MQCRDEWTTEAGQLLVSKRRHLDMLVLVAHMLSRWEFFFTLSDGDKDLFRYALLALRKRWAVPGRHLGAASWRHDGDLTSKRWCGHTMMQYDHNGVVAFVHANLIKHIAGSVLCSFATPPSDTFFAATSDPATPGAALNLSFFQT